MFAFSYQNFAMILTVFYIASTWIQTWRVNVVKKKILQYALDQSSYVFYRLPEEYEEINAFKLIPSAFAVNKDDGKLSELLWDELDYKGCLITPKVLQILPYADNLIFLFCYFYFIFIYYLLSSFSAF